MHVSLSFQAQKQQTTGKRQLPREEPTQKCLQAPISHVTRFSMRAPENKDVDGDLDAGAFGRKLLVELVVRVAQLVLRVGAPQCRIVPVLYLAEACTPQQQSSFILAQISCVI